MHKIVKLSPEIQKRICAGEVIVSPYNVLKELLENSIDAGSTQISVVVTKDNLNLEVHDNGCGIEESDFQNLALPHHTSKFETSTYGAHFYGFRGEALASIRCVSNLTIKSKTKNNELGFIRNFKEDEVIPISMNNGTSVIIKNLFFNNKIREKCFYKKLSVFRSLNELVNMFSIKNSHIRFQFNDINYFYNDKIIENNILKDNSHINEEDSHTNEEDSFDFYDELVEFKKSDQISYEKCDDFLTSFKSDQISKIYKISSLRQFSNKFITLIFSSSMINFRTYTFILFINNRLVTNQNIKSQVSKKYHNILPKGRHPFLYLELRIPVKHIDVNVHPSKKEVLIEYEDLIVEVIDKILDEGLNETKSVYKRNIDTGYTINREIIYKESSNLEDCIYSVKDQKEETEFSIKERNYEDSLINIYSRIYEHSPCSKFLEYKLLSIQNLKSEIIEIDQSFIKDIVFCGVVNLPDPLLLVQYNQYLMKCNLLDLIPVLIYHYFLYNFGNLKSKSCSFKCKTINSGFIKMLKEYFSIEIKNNLIVRVPVIGDFIGEEDKWKEFDIKNQTEEEVFREIFYKLGEIYKNVEINRSVFNVLKKDLKCTKEVLKTFTIVKCLKDLYKNFERC
ncbi:DNA mismatch repair protein [Vairimorpha necatrix]|uniref:DNA mismatch repair protein n=1 Tax=Vairimorpha necatrix TaxID=6039 RepID=A0AAX4J895_9MICR